METSIQKRDQELRDAAALLEQRVADRTRELTAARSALVEAERSRPWARPRPRSLTSSKNTLNGLGMAVELIVQEPTNTRASRACTRRSRARSRACATSSTRCCRSLACRASSARPPISPTSCGPPASFLADLVAERGGP